MLRHFFFLARRLRHEQSGNVAMVFGLMLIPMVYSAGMGVDYTKALHYKSMMQSAVDAAALAGANAYVGSTSSSTASTVATNYMNRAISQLPANNGVNFTVTPGSVSSGGSTTGYTVAVTATVQVPTSFMSLASVNLMNVQVAATAQNPTVTGSFNLNNFSSNACDGNTIYWFPIPATSDPTTYVPLNSALTKIFSNTGSNAQVTSFTMAASAQVGFAMKNVTGQKCGYGTNGFGGAQGSTHYFYSNLYPPSKVAYPSVTQNRNLQVKPMPAGQTMQQVLQGLPDQTFSYNFPNAAPSCGSLSGQNTLYAWNDMGGGSDDHDYNDGAYTFTCTVAGGGAGGGSTGVFLMQ